MFLFCHFILGTLPFVSDLSTSILSLKDSWKRGLRINNIDPNKTVEIPYIDMYDYSIQSIIYDFKSINEL